MAFPGSVTTFIPRVDLVDTVLAADVNSLQSEMTVTQTVIGTGILTPSYDSTSWSAPSGSYTSLSERLINIERGLINGVPNSPYLSKNISVQGSTGLTISSQTGNTSTLFETKNASDTVKFFIDYTGLPYVEANPVIYENSTEYNAILTYVDDAVAAATGTGAGGDINPLLLAGM